MEKVFLKTKEARALLTPEPPRGSIRSAINKGLVEAKKDGKFLLIEKESLLKWHKGMSRNEPVSTKKSAK